MLSNVDIVRELGKNIAVFPLQEKTIGPFYVNLTASDIAWSRSDSKLLKIACVNADEALSIDPRLDDLENLKKEIDDLRKRIKSLKESNGIEEEGTIEEIKSNDNNYDQRKNIIQEFGKMIEEKETELSNKEDQYRERKLETEQNIANLEKEVRNQLVNELHEKKELKFLIIPPHDTGLILTNETVAVTGKFGGLFHAIVKDVSYGRGHIATTLNPGWYGKPLIAVHNHTDKHLLVQLGSRFVKLSFHELHSKATIRPGELGSRSDIVDHLKLYRSTDYSEISNFFSGSGIDLKYLLNTFNFIRKGKYEENETEKKILLNGISAENIKKNYEKTKDRSISRFRRILKYHLWDIISIIVAIIAGIVFFKLMSTNDFDKNKEIIISSTSAIGAAAIGRLITKYINNK